MVLINKLSIGNICTFFYWLVSLFQEPVENVDDIVKFCEETGLPAALDETIDNFQESHLKMLAKYTHPGIVAVVSGAEYSLYLDHHSCGSRDTGSLALLRWSTHLRSLGRWFVDMKLTRPDMFDSIENNIYSLIIGCICNYINYRFKLVYDGGMTSFERLTGSIMRA